MDIHVEGLRSLLIESSLRLVQTLFSAPAVSVFLYNAEDEVLTLEYSFGEASLPPGSIVAPVDGGIVGHVFQSGEACLICDLVCDVRFDMAATDAAGRVPSAILAVPLATATDVLGVIEVLDPSLALYRDLTALSVISEIGFQVATAMTCVDQMQKGSLNERSMPTSNGTVDESQEEIVGSVLARLRDES